MTQGYDPAKAALFNQLIQDGLSEDAALAQAGISAADLGNYEINNQGQIGPIEIGFGKTPGVNNVTNNAAAQADITAFDNANAVSASSVNTSSTTTTTTSGGGVTTRVAGDGTPTTESQVLQAQADATYNDIKAISRELGAPQFGGNPNLTQDERNVLIAQREALYQQYNQTTSAATNALAPSAPVGSSTVPNTTTQTTTTEFTKASANSPVSGAEDSQLQQQEIASTGPRVPVSAVQTSNSATAGLTPAQLEALGGADPTDPFIRARLDLPPLGPAQPTLISSISDLFSSKAPSPVPESAIDKSPAATDAGAGIQRFDDGSFRQTFDDGSVLTGDTENTLSSTPAEVNPQVDPEASLAPGEEIVPDSEIDKSPASTNYGASIQTFDDGTTLQTFDDGSVLATGTDGSVTSSPADVSATDYYNNGTTATSAETNGTEQQSAQNDWQAEVARTQAEAAQNGTAVSAEANADAASAAAFRDKARQQQTIASQRKQINNGDWRVRLRLAPQSKYLYNAPTPGILQPLTVTDGVIFPYTPAITTSYKANYSSYELTHSNYKGYFYTNSAVEALNLTATFTAQDTNEANYLLAVIHFFRSATKMFYGQDAERGSPPPLVFLTGLGEYQFNEHACLIQSFSYNLPADVNYIRAGSVSNTGTNLTTRRDRQNVATNGVFGSLNRLAAAFLTKGAIPNTPSPATLGTNRPTYVPTKIEIQLALLPVQSRQQVSKQFSVKEFANGNLLRGGFW